MKTTTIKHYSTEEILFLIEAQLELPRNSLKAGDDLLELGADSLDMIELVMELEADLNIEIMDEHIVELKLNDTDNLIKYIQSL